MSKRSGRRQDVRGVGHRVGKTNAARHQASAPGRFDRAVARLRRHPVVAAAALVASVVVTLSTTTDAVRNLWRQLVFAGPSAAARQSARDSLSFEGMAVTDTTAFFRRVRAGDVAVVRLFLVAGFPPNALDGEGGRSGWPPLAVAARNGDSSMVALLLQAGAGVDHATTEGYQPLALAVVGGSHPVVRLLLARGADAGHAAENGVTAVHGAAEAGDTAMLALLLRAVPPARTREIFAPSSPSQRTPLTLAASRGRVEATRLLLEAGASPAYPAAAMPLCSAVAGASTNVPSDAAAAGAHSARYDAVVRLLVEKGGASTDPSCAGHSVLAPLASAGDTAIAGYLIARGADPDRVWSNEGSALYEAASACTAEARAGARFLLAHGARVDRGPPNGRTPLMAAGCLENVDLLLSAGADVNARDDSGATPLLYAAPWDVPVLTRLLARGADARIAAADGRTALMHIAEEPMPGSTEPPNAAVATRLLLRAGADRAARRADGRTALDLARENGFCAVAALLGGRCAP